MRLSVSLIATHQYRTRPYLLPNPRISPVTRLSIAAMNMGQTVTSSSDCRVNAHTAEESVKIAVETSTAMATSTSADLISGTAEVVA